ncbi:MAG: SDR family oxidoreductase [Anaerolineae bacterium]|nr:SDR family oxidoreductase [Anaerolineae bacterium]
MNLKGKTALVTGAAHRVGKAIALALAREGVSIIVHYGRSADAAQQTIGEITALGVEALPVQADLRDPAQIAALFQAVEDRFGHLDILVNSAASFVKQPFEDVTVDSWKDVMQANLRAPFLCSQHAARLMRAVQRPADEPALIVNIADLSGLQVRSGYVQHGISKAGLLHLTNISAHELAPDIRVNAIIPGPILPPPGVSPDSERWQQIGARVPLRRPGHPGHIGQTVVFLATNDYITGAAIPVDGGEHLIDPTR